MKNKLGAEISSFNGIWEGGFRTGYDKKRNQKGIEEYLIKDIKNKCVLEIGCGGGQWSKFMYKYVDNLYCVDILSEDHNQFWKYVGEEKKDKIKYFQIKDFSLNEIENNSIDYVFSYDVFCHISMTGQAEYLKNLLLKCKNSAQLFIMYADAVKYFDNEPENIWIQEEEQGIYNDNDKLINKLVQECDGHPYPGRWYWIGIDNFIYLCEKYGYHVIQRDLNIDKTNPITLFQKPKLI